MGLDGQKGEPGLIGDHGIPGYPGGKGEKGLPGAPGIRVSSVECNDIILISNIKMWNTSDRRIYYI